MGDSISFIWPWLLTGLLVVPLLIWFYGRIRRRHDKAMADLGAFGLARNQAGQALGRRRHGPPLAYLVGLTFLLIALARPQMVVSLPRIQGTVILAFDVSNSMRADDLEPTRMEAAKTAAQAFVQNQPSTIQIGVVAFGAGGLIVQPPTNDQTALLDAIARLSPEGGTSLGQGIFTALNAIAGETITLDEAAVDTDTGTLNVDQIRIDDYSSAVILLLSDGENTSRPDPLEVAQVAAEAGVRIYPIGIGSDEGAILEVDGFNLVTRLDETSLQEIANVTNGKYYRAEDEQTLQDIYQNVDLQLTISAEKMEVTALFAGVGALFFLLGAALSMLWLGRVP